MAEDTITTFIPEHGIELEFPAGTPQDVIERETRSSWAQAEQAKARSPSSTYIARVAQQVGEQGEQVFGRISLGGLGRIAGALAKDLVTGNVPAPDPTTGLMTGGMRATAAELLGQETPFDIEESVQGSVVRRGIVGGARSLPTVGAGMLLSGPLAPVVAMGTAFGASAAEESGGDPIKTAKGAALGAALPVVGAAGRTVTGVLSAAAANRGIQAAAVPAIQKAAEFVGSQVPVQGIMLADLMASPEYRSASPDEQRDMIAEMSVANLAFALPEVVHAVNPRTSPAAARFESPMVDMARGTAPMNREVQGQPTQPAGPVQRPAPVVMEGQPVIDPPASDTPVLGEARAQVVRQPRPEIQFPDNPVVAPEAPSNVRTDVGGGRVSFAAEAPTLTSNVPDQTADALRREAAPPTPVAKPVERGPNVTVPTRQPAPPTTAIEWAKRKAKESVEEGLTLPQENPTEEPAVGQLPESGPGAGVLSRAQRRKLIAAEERRAGIRPGTKGKPTQAPSTAGTPKSDPIKEAAREWNDAVSAIEAAPSKELTIRTLDSGAQALERMIAILERNGLPADREYKLLEKADNEITRRLKREGDPNPVMRPGTTESPPIPEDPAAIAEQVRLTGDPASTKAATLVTKGETTPEVPEGLKATETPHGTVVWNPAKTTEAEVKKAGEGELFDARLLGQSSGVPVEGRNVVTTSTEAAKNVVTEIVPDGNPEAVKAAVEAQQAAVPGGTTEVKPAVDVAKERVAANQPKKPTVIDVDDLDAVERFLASKIDPKLDEPGAVHTGVPKNLIVRAALAAYKKGKSATDAISEAIEIGRKRGEMDADEARAYLAAGMAEALQEQARGKGQKTRRFAQRAAISPDVPLDVRLKVASDPRTVYDPQRVVPEADAASLRDDLQLAADKNDPKSNTSVISGLEMVKRSIAKGDDATTTSLLVELATRGTTLGQLVNQFKLLKGVVPEYIPILTDKYLQKAGYDKLTDTQRKRLTDLSRDAIEAHAKTTAADADYLANRSPDNWQKVADAFGAEQEANAAMNLELAKWHPRTMEDVLVATLQGNLMTPISQVANVVGNALRLTYDPSARTLAAVADAVESGLTGNPRTVSIRPVTGSIQKLKALAQASRVAADIAKRGADTAHYEAGEKGGVALNAVRAWRDFSRIVRGVAEMPTRNGRIPAVDMVKLGIEGTFGAPADVMFRGLAAMDVMFRVPERARLVFDAAKAKGLSDAEASRAVLRPELFLDKEALKRVDFEAARQVYQQENLATEGVAAVNRVLRKVPGAYLLSKTVAPYQKTPINVMGEILTWMPVTGWMKLWSDLGYPGMRRQAARAGRPMEVNRREANLTASKMFLGTMITAAAAWAYSKGVITPPLDADDETQKTRLGATDVIPPNHINLSGLKRAINGGDPSPKPDDDVRDLRRLGLPGGIMFMTAHTLRQAEKKRSSDAGTVKDIALTAPTTVAAWSLNQTFMQGAADFIKKLSGDDASPAISSWIQTVSAIPAPNTLASVNRAIRDSKPEFRDDDSLKALGNKINEKVNMLGFSVPMGRDTKALPLKVDMWGRPIAETPQGNNPYVWSFFDITKHRTIPDDAVAIELYNLWRRTTDNAVFPSLPSRIITHKGKQSEPVTYDQYQKLAEFIGQRRRNAMERLVGGEIGNWGEWDDEQKLKALRKVYDKGHEIGVEEFKKWVVESGETLTPRNQRRGMVGK